MSLNKFLTRFLARFLGTTYPVFVRIFIDETGIFVVFEFFFFFFFSSLQESEACPRRKPRLVDVKSRSYAGSRVAKSRSEIKLKKRAYTRVRADKTHATRRGAARRRRNFRGSMPRKELRGFLEN